MIQPTQHGFLINLLVQWSHAIKPLNMNQLSVSYMYNTFQQLISVDVSLTIVGIVETLLVPLAGVQDLLDVEVSPSVTAENRSLWWARSGLQTKAETNPFILGQF